MPDSDSMAKATISGCPAMKRNGSVPRYAQNAVVNDTGLLEALSHFNREKIPERVVHAKGTGAYGEFEVSHDGLPCRRHQFLIYEKLGHR
jgi:catalase